MHAIPQWFTEQQLYKYTLYRYFTHYTLHRGSDMALGILQFLTIWKIFHVILLNA